MTPEGFEPPTVGAEIQYSIQLNYGAISMSNDYLISNRILLITHYSYLERNLHTSQNLCTENLVSFVRLVF